MKLSVYDSKSKMDLKIKDTEFFVEGALLGGNTDLCYVPVFQSGLGMTDEWQVGSAMMKEYYVVYDQTPYDERSENYNFIGIGIQNNDAEMLKRHYDYSLANQEAGGFHPA
jgi:hypothetical protein